MESASEQLSKDKLDQSKGDSSDENGIGAGMKRREDPPLLTGEAKYTDDISKRGMLHIGIVRSQQARAKLIDIDVGEAESRDGVLCVYTGKDIVDSKAPGNISPHIAPPYATIPDRPILPTEEVRYYGEPVAVVIAKNRYSAHNAVAGVDVTYAPVDAITDPKVAVKPDSPAIHHNCPDNIGLETNIGDEAATDEAFEKADTTVSIELENQRLHPSPIEPRAIVAEHVSATNELKVEMTTQNPHRHRELLSGTLDIPESKIDVRAPDVGGGFGSKIHHYQEDALVSWCAIQLNKPVKWQARRSETYLSDAHGRGHHSQAELAIDTDGQIHGLRVETYANFGAYLSTDAVVPVESYSKMLSGQYDISAVDVSAYGVYTNTAPVDAYRGAGRPEATYLVERIMKSAATELDIDPVQLRKKNFIQPEDFPKEVATGHTYDSGNYIESLTKALEMINYDEWRHKQSNSSPDSSRVGIGISCYVEACGSGPGLFESGRVRLAPSGDVTVEAGTADQGQGHASAFAQIAADELGINHSRIRIQEGDTTKVPEGIGTFGSRSIPVGGSAVIQSARSIQEKSKKIVAHHLDVPIDTVMFDDGTFHVAGDDSVSMDIADVAELAYNKTNLPDGMKPGLEATTYYDPDNYTFTFGTHVAVVSVETNTGGITIERYVAVDDCGTRINPKLVEGQIHGGIAQGIGQALSEVMQYDDSGRLLTTTMQDYATPRAEDMPELEVSQTVTKSPHNPTGSKGVGEAGAIGAPPAIANAVMDAVGTGNVTHLDMPLTSEKVWRAINDVTE